MVGELEREFNQWAMSTRASRDVFSVITWLDMKGMLLSEAKRHKLIQMRDELIRIGWMETARILDDVLKG